MKPIDRLVSACRHCRFYKLEGRRGGHCQLLDVSIQGSWTACALAASPFTTKWQELEELMALQTPIELQAMVQEADLINPALVEPSVGSV
ncbi:hypothetical protein IFO70_18475 [Phormidium tenue FACHB-886]|nr:hypothetical protein [Phormidium tenue FACHB-886]